MKDQVRYFQSQNKLLEAQRALSSARAWTWK